MQHSSLKEKFNPKETEIEKRLFPERYFWNPRKDISPMNFYKQLKEKDTKFMSLHEGKINHSIPSGYTYLGQFIAHDLTFDPSTEENLGTHQQSSQNLRTPILDLDSIYGGGPLSSPNIYNQQINHGRTHFLLDTNEINIEGKLYYSFDLPRKLHGSDLWNPIIPDHRNDENFIVSQLHLAIQIFHNKVIEYLDQERLQQKTKNAVKEAVSKKGKSFINSYDLVNNFNELLDIAFPEPENYLEFWQEPKKYILKSRRDKKKIDSIVKLEPALKRHQFSYYKDLFKEARNEVKWHFQWVVLFDYLPKIVGTKLFYEVLGIKEKTHKLQRKHKSNRKLFFWKDKPYIPVEFSVAAFRFGHSMIARRYKFTDKPKNISKNLFKAKKRNNRPKDIYLDWSFFFYTNLCGGENKSTRINAAIETKMANELPIKQKLRNIVLRNLLRGIQNKLPSGQKVAELLGATKLDHENFKDVQIYKVLKDNFPEIINSDNEKLSFEEFCNNSPLWFYILMEADVLGNLSPDSKSNHLGPVGGQIVAEVIIGILEGDPNSFFNENSNWKPWLFKDIPLGKECSEKKKPRKNKVDLAGDNSMIQLLKFAGVYRGALVNNNFKD